VRDAFDKFSEAMRVLECEQYIILDDGAQDVDDSIALPFEQQALKELI
jgi:hypothetical protein